jgi:cell division protein FtsB
MTDTLFSQIQPEDWGMFVLHYLPSLLVASVVAMAGGVLIVIAKRKGESRPRNKIRLVLCVAPIMIWFAFFAVTAKWTLTVKALDSEFDGAAEYAYRNLLPEKVRSADDALRLAMDSHQIQNVRFYAACFAADLLATNDDTTVQIALKKVENAPIVTPGFFGTNAINFTFYVPGYAQPRLSVREVIMRRLEYVRGLKNAG